MKTRIVFGCTALILLLVSAGAFAEEQERAVVNYSLWVGSHYTKFDDYPKLIGEYNRGEDEAVPELIFDLKARKKDGYLRFDGHFYDQDNLFAKFSAKKSDRVSFAARYVSLIHQDGLDMLANLEAREWLGSNPGGKMTTHEVLDLGSEYATDRHQIETDLKVKLSKKYNVNFYVTHRTILEKGFDQKIAVSHCFSCHVKSEAFEVDEQTHQVKTGIEAEIKDFEVGYSFAYRKFESNAADPSILYDRARHPVNGGAAAEFASRLLYDGEEVDFSVLPSTEKITHKGSIRGKLGKGRVAGSLGVTQTENKRVEIESSALTGALAYAVPVHERVRMVAKVNAMRLEADDFIIDLPYWREGRPDNNPVNFDFKRYSAIDRIEGKGTLEVITRLNPRTALSVFGGYKRSERMDYPTPATAYTTNKYIGQAKVRYNHGLKYGGSLKYRYEHTQDPLRSERGLLEASGRDVLERTTPTLAFYYQREDLRFLNVTSLPTDYHEVALSGSIRPRDGFIIGVGLKTSYDQNNDLDTLDVNHFAFQPNVNLTVNPNERATITAGYTFNHYVSRGPITIPIFDG